MLCEILSFLPIDQLLRLNSASRRFYAASQLIYEPIRRPFPARNLEQIRLVSYGRDLQFICADFNFENVFHPENAAEFKGPLLYTRTIIGRKDLTKWQLSRRNQRCKFVQFLYDSVYHASYPAGRRWQTIIKHLNIDEDDFDGDRFLIGFHDLPNTEPPSNIRLIGPITLKLYEIDKTDVKILLYYTK